jgi:hypothetical protein
MWVFRISSLILMITAQYSTEQDVLSAEVNLLSLIQKLLPHTHPYVPMLHDFIITPGVWTHVRH